MQKQRCLCTILCQGCGSGGGVGGGGGGGDQYNCQLPEVKRWRWCTLVGGRELGGSITVSYSRLKYGDGVVRGGGQYNCQFT